MPPAPQTPIPENGFRGVFVNVRLNLPGFSSTEHFPLSSAPTSLAGLACTVLEEIGGLSKKELQGVGENLDHLPLALFGELHGGKLIELTTDAQLEVYLATVDSPRGPAIIEIRPRDVDISTDSLDEGSTYHNAMVPKMRQESEQLSPRSEMTKYANEQRQARSSTNNAYSGTLGHEIDLATAPAPAVNPITTVLPQPTGAPIVADSTKMVATQNGAAAPRGMTSKQPLQPHRPNGNASDAPQKTTTDHRGPPVTCHKQPPDSKHADIKHAEMSPVPPPATSNLQATPTTMVNESFEQPLSPVWNSAREGGRSQTSEVQSLRGPSTGTGKGRVAASRPSSTPLPERRQRYVEHGGTMCPIPTTEASQGRSRVPNHKGSRGQNGVPAHIRLYQEKDDRKRRLEEARLRFLEKEEEEVRISAQYALGRTGASRAQSPSRDRDPSPVSIRGVTVNAQNTPPRARPPLPEQRFEQPQPEQRPEPRPERRPEKRADDRLKERPSSAGTRSSRTRHKTHPTAAGVGGVPRVDNIAQEVEAVQMVPQPSATDSPAATLADVSSVASGSGMNHRAYSAASGVTSGGEESGCGEGETSIVNDDIRSLRQLVATQQKRIEFLETMHHQALCHLRKSREELAVVQQQRFREADKVLELEQLISEMQAHHFNGDAHDQVRWEKWLQQSRTILGGE